MKELINSLKNDFAYTSLQISEWTKTSHVDAKYEFKEHHNVLRDIRDEIKNLTKGNMRKFACENFEEAHYIHEQNNQKFPMFKLTRLGVQQLCMRYDAVTRAKINLKIDELEKREVKALPQNYKEALLALVTAEEEKEQLQIERDTAVKTKSQISRKREATVMGQYSQAKQKLERLTNTMKRENEYNSSEVAIKIGLFSRHSNPHSAPVNAFFEQIPEHNKTRYGRTVINRIQSGGKDIHVPINYYNDNKCRDTKLHSNIIRINGRNYNFI